MKWITGTCYNGTPFLLNLDNVAMMMPDSQSDYTQVVMSGGTAYYLNIKYETLQKVMANIPGDDWPKKEEKENA